MNKSDVVQTIGRLGKCMDNATTVDKINDTLKFMENGKLYSASVKVMLHAGRDINVLELKLPLLDLPIVSDMLTEIKNIEETRLKVNVKELSKVAEDIPLFEEARNTRIDVTV